VIHAPVRLRICATLDPVREVEFGSLLTLLDISKSARSKHISVPADAGYIAPRRAVRDTRQRVWLSLTESIWYRGEWQSKSRNGPAASPAMILKTSQCIRLKSLQDHGSTAGGGWQNKSPKANAAAW
jgi:Winged helix DNA-binding domain